MTLTNRRPPKWALGLTAIVGAAVAGIAYSALAIDHRRRLDPAVPGEQTDLWTSGGRVTLYGSHEGKGAPLLLVHSINAAASAYEMRPLFQYYIGLRPVMRSIFRVSASRKDAIKSTHRV
jgi:hypothetical protein